MSTVILDTITGKSTATTITIGSTPVVSASANSMTIRGEGSAQTSIQQGLIKQWAKVDGQAATIDDSFNVSSVADSAVGKKELTATNNMSSANYSVTSTTFFDANIDAGMHPFVEVTFSTSVFRIIVLEYDSTSPGDCNSHFTQSTGDLA
jgi:hypothetical protein